MRQSTISLTCLPVLAAVILAPSALSQGKGEGGLVVRDGAVIYASSKGPRVEVKDLPRGFPVVGVTTLGMGTTFQFEEEDGRLHIWYLKMNDKGEYKSVQKSAWMDPADLERFRYECGCEAGAEAGRKCSPLAVSGMAARSWNSCFKEAYSRKLADLKAGDAGSSAMAAANTPDSIKPSASSPSEKPITNADIVALAKVGLGDDVVVSKVQQAPKEALDVSADALIKLKKEGLSTTIIEAMIKRAGQRH